MKNKILIPTLLALLCSSTSKADAADNSEKSISTKISCPNKAYSRTLVKIDGGHWCDSVFPDICSERKARVTRQVCGNSYKAKLLRLRKNKGSLATLVSSKQKHRETLLAEKQKIELERQLLEVRQHELDIRKKELELVKKKQALITKSSAWLD